MTAVVLQNLGCAHTVPDVPICYELGLTKGTCVMTISGNTFDVNDADPKLTWPLKDAWAGKTWWEIRHLMLAVPAEPSFVPMRSFIIKICRDMNTCQNKVKSWERNLEKVDSIRPK